MVWLLDAKYLNDYNVLLKFNNNEERVVNLEKHLNGGIFEDLKDIEYFKTLKFNKDSDTIEWDNGADFSPEFLYEISVKVSKIA